jgi:plastocyanin
MRYGRDMFTSKGSSWVRVLMVAACASVLVITLVTTAQARPVLIRGIGTQWTPSTVTVARGTVVKWRGVTNFHDIIAYGGNWTFHQALPTGSAVKRRFRTTGTFRFRCTYHSTLIGNTCTGMCGKVVIRS